VEDEQAVRALTRHGLQRAGYTVLEAADGAAALAVSDAHPGPIHLLVADVVMPEVGGPELARRLAERRPGLKVLFVSGYAGDAVVRHGLVAPGADFLQKPFTLEMLARKVREVLDRR
jgi:CheY-like chemotaxis protein